MTSAKTIFVNLSFTHKVHEKSAELMALGSKIMRLLVLVSLLFSLAVQLAQLIPDITSTSLTFWGIVAAIVGIGLSFYQLSFNYDKQLDAHRETAKDLLGLKNRMIVSMDTAITKTELEVFVDEVNAIYRRAPQTGWLANSLASWKPKSKNRKR